MPKPVDAESAVTDAVVGEEEAPASSQQGGVKVNLEEKAPKTPVKEGVKEPTGASDAEERRWKALESQVAAARRINEDLKRQVQSLSDKLQKPVAPVPESGAQVLPKGTAQETVDKYDQLVEAGKWQEAVRLLSREEYKVSREVEVAQEQVRAVEARRVNALERSKQKVRDAYPTLHEDSGTPEAPESVLYNQAVAQLTQEDDQFIHDPYAPELAMHRMEQLAREQGIPLARMSPTKAPVRSVGRAGQTSMPASRGSGGASTYTLSREQKEWCDVHFAHLPEAERYKNYARYAKMSETTGGVEA